MKRKSLRTIMLATTAIGVMTLTGCDYLEANRFNGMKPAEGSMEYRQDAEVTFAVDKNSGTYQGLLVVDGQRFPIYQRRDAKGNVGYMVGTPEYNWDMFSEAERDGFMKQQAKKKAEDTWKGIKGTFNHLVGNAEDKMKELDAEHDITGKLKEFNEEYEVGSKWERFKESVKSYFR